MKIYKFDKMGKQATNIVYGEGWIDKISWRNHKKPIRDIIDQDVDPVGYDMFGTDWAKNEIKVFWAKDGDKYIGYAAADFTDYFSVASPVLKEQPPTQDIENYAKLYVYVVPEYRGMGVGKVLYNMAKTEIMEAKKEVAFFPSDGGALSFYKKIDESK